MPKKTFFSENSSDRGHRECNFAFDFTFVFQMMWFTTCSYRHCFGYLCFFASICAIFFNAFSSTYTRTPFFVDDTDERKKLQILARSIWPKEGEDKDRVELQIRLGYNLAEYVRKHDKPSNASKKIIILVPDPHYLYETFVDGDSFFKMNCPLTNCVMTKDIRRYKATADAIILLRFQASYIKYFQPKPKKQVMCATALWYVFGDCGFYHLQNP